MVVVYRGQPRVVDDSFYDVTVASAGISGGAIIVDRSAVCPCTRRGKRFVSPNSVEQTGEDGFYRFADRVFRTEQFHRRRVVFGDSSVRDDDDWIFHLREHDFGGEGCHVEEIVSKQREGDKHAAAAEEDLRQIEGRVWNEQCGNARSKQRKESSKNDGDRLLSVQSVRLHEKRGQEGEPGENDDEQVNDVEVKRLCV
ncbi:hypothetical protein GCM10009000_074060 [Halobacterium noricense]|uniref:Uncharacterized protein n=1 Tax=Haladaptatus pallidirubidus TaxID=1008152 RepID=A0AAV3ULR0_9EURY